MSLTSSRRLRRTDKRRALGTPRRRHLRVERLEERVVLSAGFVTTSIGESAVAYDHFVEQDGDIIVAGYSSPAGNDPTTFAIARYQENGALDPSFGNAGSVMTSIARANDYGMAVAAYPDNKVVLAGNGYDAYSSFDADFAVARYDQYGNLDKTFGGKAKNAGKVQIDVGQDRTYDVMVQPDEKIVGAGCIRQDGEDYSEFTLVRYTTAGKLDADFGNGGIVTTDIGDKGSFVQAVTVHQDGILAAGHTVNIATGSDFAIARYLLDGNLDTSFGEDSSGIIVMDFNSEPGWGTGDEIEAVVTDGDKFYVAGRTGFRASEAGVSQELTIVRFDANGSMDPTFGDGGRLSVRAEYGQVPVSPHVSDMVLHDGKLVVAGYAWDSTQENHPDNFFVARFDPDLEDWLAPGLKGGLDPEFGGGDGWVMSPILVSSQARSVAIQPTTGKIVVSGYADTGSANVFAVARYDSTGHLDQSFGNPDNDPPVAFNDMATTDKFTSIVIDVLANDTDPDGNALSAVLVEGPEFGTVTPRAGGSFTYTPDGIYSGQTTFTYLATDGTLESNVATVTVSVEESQNLPPVAQDDVYIIGQGQKLVVEAPGVLKNDTDPDSDLIWASIVTGPTKGSLALYNGGGFEYIPDPGIVDTTDQFVYEVSDGNLHPDPVTATVTITIAPPSNGSEFSINDVAKREGKKGRATSFTFTITRTGDVSGPTSIHYATEDNTATSFNTGIPGSHDYSAKSGVLQFGDGQTAATIIVTVTGDAVYENGGVAETFFVNIWSAVGETIVDDQGIGTITNDDRAKLLSGFESGGTAGALRTEQLKSITEQALALWSSQTQIVLPNIQATVADLPAGQLGEAYDDSIIVDINADGAGWYVEARPEIGQRAITAGRVDLLTVVSHELGHLMGYGHSRDEHGVMAAALPLDARRLPGLGQVMLTSALNHSLALPALSVIDQRVMSHDERDSRRASASSEIQGELELYLLPDDPVVVDVTVPCHIRSEANEARIWRELFSATDDQTNDELLELLAEK